MSHLFKAFLVIVAVQEVFSQDILKLVVEMTRHGARAPSLTQQTDLFGFNWEGDNQLTNIGIRQHYILGQQLRDTYITKRSFLSPGFNLSEFNIYSTPWNRTIISAISHLNGIYPPGSGQTVFPNQTISSRPPIKINNLTAIETKLGNFAMFDKISAFPLHILEKSNHLFNMHAVKICPRVKSYINKNLNQKEVLSFLDHFNSTYYDKLTHVVKIPANYFKNYLNAYKFFDTFWANVAENRNFEKFKAAGIDIEDLKIQALKFFQLYFFEINFGDKESYIARISMSKLVKRIIAYFSRRVHNDKNNIGYTGGQNPKYVLFSCHDVNIAAMQVYLNAAFKTNNKIVPLYASSMFFELYLTNSTAPTDLTEDNYKIKIILDNQILYEESLPSFKSATKGVFVPSSKVSYFCELENVKSNAVYISLVIMLSIISMVLLLVVIFLYLTIKTERVPMLIN